jgi:microcin C transport system permease protein
VAAYIVRRVLLMIPTLFGILLINFAVIQFMPGGPVEQLLAELRGQGSVTERFTGATGGELRGPTAGTSSPAPGGEGSRYRGAQGIDPALLRDLERQFGLDKPAGERFLLMVESYLTFDFGKSWFRDKSVMALVAEKLPVSISLGLWTTLLIYLISIPLGIRKAVRDGSRFDASTTTLLLGLSAIPSFLFALLLVVFFAGGSFLRAFPLQGLYSSNFAELTLWQQVLDYAWHMVLPVTAMVIGGFAGLTILTKNCFIDEIAKQYVQTARAKGCAESRVLYGHVFRNAMLLIIAGFPAAFIGIFFSGNLIIETIFSLDGLGLLGFESALKRDYPVMLGTLYVFTLLGLVIHLITDITYTLVDPRIDFSAR